MSPSPSTPLTDPDPPRDKKTNLLKMNLLIAAGLLLTSLALTAFQCESLCSTYPETTALDAIHPRAVVNAASPRMLDIWIDISLDGVYSPTLRTGGGMFHLLQGDEVQGLPSFLDELAEKGYLAIRVPHAPPTHTAASLIPGIPSVGSPYAIEFSYYSPPYTSTRTTVPITATRNIAYEAIVNQKYPITDGKSHWEVWWIEGNRFPVPTDTFRLKRGSPQAIEVTFRIDFGAGSNALDCAGCTVEYLLYNGYNFIGPSELPLIIETTPWPAGNPRVAFDMCGEFASRLQYITPTVPFTHSHWLGNYESITRTYTVTASSSQGWDYIYYHGPTGQTIQQAPGLPFTVEVGAAPTGPPYAGCTGIWAVYTPTIAVTDTMRETLVLTATSTVSPTTVWAEVTSMALAPGYQLNEGGGFNLYLPLVLKNYTP